MLDLLLILGRSGATAETEVFPGSDSHVIEILSKRTLARGHYTDSIGHYWLDEVCLMSRPSVPGWRKIFTFSQTNSGLQCSAV